MGEETSVLTPSIAPGYTWIVDPIDGTTNFANGNPHFCVSIGLALDGEPVVGAIYNPITQELFSAAKNHGANLNEHQIVLDRKVARMVEESLLITELGKLEEAPQASRLIVQNILPHVRGVRMLGSAALNLCFVACGRADGYFQRGLQCWDICAGVVIVREAGGHVVMYSGSTAPFDLSKGEVVAGRCPSLTRDLVLMIGKGNSANTAESLSEAHYYY